MMPQIFRLALFDQELAVIGFACLWVSSLVGMSEDGELISSTALHNAGISALGPGTPEALACGWEFPCGEDDSVMLVVATGCHEIFLELFPAHSSTLFLRDNLFEVNLLGILIGLSLNGSAEMILLHSAMFRVMDLSWLNSHLVPMCCVIDVEVHLL